MVLTFIGLNPPLMTGNYSTFNKQQIPLMMAYELRVLFSVFIENETNSTRDYHKSSLLYVSLQIIQNKIPPPIPVQQNSSLPQF